MKRILNTFLKIVIVLVLLPLFVVFGLFIYAKTMNPDAEEKMKEMTEWLEKSSLPGNGFGGEEAMMVIDSGYRSEKYFWVDNERLAFQTSYSAYAPKDVQRTYIWNIRDNSIKPLSCDCSIITFYGGRIHYARFSTTQTMPDGRRRADRLQATLVELDDRWVLEKPQNMEELFESPSDRYELSWKVDGKPWFRIKSDLHNSGDVSKHRFLYLWEWGWILRLPWVGPEYWNQNRPEMGFFDIDGNLYFGQSGKKVSNMPSLPARDYPGIKVRYIQFLDKFWFANTVYGDQKRKWVMGFIGRDGVFTEVARPKGWPEYSGIPLPTKKGLLWSGRDFRIASPSPYENGLFLMDRDGRIYKIVQGSVFGSELSNDGCVIAFFSTPAYDKDDVSLKVFNVCQSNIHGKELHNVDY